MRNNVKLELDVMVDAQREGWWVDNLSGQNIPSDLIESLMDVEQRAGDVDAFEELAIGHWYRAEVEYVYEEDRSVGIWGYWYIATVEIIGELASEY